MSGCWRPLEAAHAAQPHCPDLRDRLAAVYLAVAGPTDKRLLKQAVLLSPQSPAAHHKLGLWYFAQGRPAGLVKAQYQLELAVALSDGASCGLLAGLLTDLACVYRQREWWELALRTLLRATQLRPCEARTLTMAAALLCAKGEVGQALDLARRATVVDGGFAEGWNSLAVILRDAGEVEAAIEAFQQCLRLEPDHLHAHHSLLMSLVYCRAEVDVLSQHASWGERMVLRAQQVGLFRPARSLRDGGLVDKGRLRVGYLSPDFRGHSVSYFVEHLFRFHERTRGFQVFFLHDSVEKDDGKTALLRSLCGEDEWVKTGELDETHMLQLLRSLQLDILVELAGHSGNNRLRLLACRVAPVQISYVGYPATTGLDTVDFRIVDCVSDPDNPISHTTTTTERLLRFPAPQAFLCYSPPSLPTATSTSTSTSSCGLCRDVRLTGTPVVFCSFNTLSKLQPPVLAAWRRILAAVPESVLVLKSKALQSTEIAAKLVSSGELPKDRVVCLGMTQDIESHFHTYSHVHIALDSFPYAGTTTTCEALYNGVPVVTCVGAAHSQNVSASLIRAVGVEALTDALVADSVDEYVRKAVALAVDRVARDCFSRNLREWMLASPLCDGVAHCRSLERLLVGAAASSAAAARADAIARGAPVSARIP